MKRTRMARTAGVMFLDGFRAAPGWMTVVTVMLVVGSVAGTCYPLGYRLMVDGVLARSAGGVVAGILVVAGLLSVGWVLTAVGASEAMALSDRIAMYRTAQLIHLISGVPGIEHLERPDYLTDVERLNANRRQLASAPRSVLTSTAAVARVLALLALMAYVSPWLLLLPLCTVAPLAADQVAKTINRQADNAMGASRRLADLVFGLMTEPGAASEVRSYGLVPHLTAVHRRLTDEVNRSSAVEALQILAVQGLGWLIYAAGIMAAIAFVVVRAADGAMSLGTLLMAVSLIRRSRNTMASTAQSSGGLAATLVTADRLFWLEDYARDEVGRAGRREPPAALRDGIVLSGVSFAYPGTERAVLSDLDLVLPAGSTVALIGENGSGKTTLVKLLLGLYRPSAGTILVDGMNLNELAPERWRERTTAAFQDYSRLQLPALEAVGVGHLPDMTDEPGALRALDRAGAGELVGQLPDGLATHLGGAYTGGHGLSGGQWQKVALGRAMRRNAPLLVVLDEPTASLDAQAEHALFERYTQAAATSARETGAVTLLVSHRLSTVRMADRIVLMDGGRILEVGSHEELLRLKGRYAELFELQAAGYR
jgi:ATP-binding cassette, subfamily B, bacterial